MIVLRQGKAKKILDSSMNSAITAVEIYNKPNVKYKTENFIVLMTIAWIKLFHAYFHSTIGDKYYYKESNGKYKYIDGEKKAWELNKCVVEYNKLNKSSMLPEPVIKNLEFFIKIRNKIEHRYWESSALDIDLFGECQALLYNYETYLIELFGDENSINASLAFALQFSHKKVPKQIEAQKELLSKDMKDIKKFIDKYRNDLNQEVFDSQEYSIKLIQIPKISNTNRSDLSVEFVNWSMLSEDDKESYEKLTVLIKDKIVNRQTINGKLYRLSQVCVEVENRSGIKLSSNNHTILWKYFDVRPETKSIDKSNTNDKYCMYDEAHNDYVYTAEWIDYITKFIKDNDLNASKINKLYKNQKNSLKN